MDRRTFPAAAVTLVLGTSGAAAQVSQLVGYQGRLLRSDGTASTGTAAVTFQVFASESGGSALWIETQTLGLSDGFYATLLGLATPFGDGLFDAGPRWLELRVGSETLSPRQKIGAVPLALAAQSVSGGTADVTSLKVAGQTVVDASGRLAGSARYAAGPGIAIDAGQTVSLRACAAGQTLVRDTTGWQCAAAAAGTVTGVAAAAPLTVTDGTTAPFVSMPQAGAAASGYLSSDDWSLFHSKYGSSTQCVGDLGGTLGAPVVAGLQSRPLSAAAPAAGQVIKWNGAQWEPAADAFSPGTVTGVVAHAPLTVWNGTSVPEISLAAARADTDGYLSSADWVRFDAAYDSDSLCGGDLAGTFGSPVVARLQGVGVATATPAASQVLRFDGSRWAPASLGIADVSGISSGYLDLSGSQTVGGAKMFTVAPEFGTPLGVGSGGIGTASAAANAVFAGPLVGSGAPAFRGLDATDIPPLDASKIATGTLGIAGGGTGTGAAPTAAGQFLRSSAAGIWSVGAIQASDLSGIAGGYVTLTSAQTLTGTKTFNSAPHFNPQSGNAPFYLDSNLSDIVTYLNADRLDGKHASDFAQLSGSPTFAGTVTAGAFSTAGSVTLTGAGAFTGSGSGITGLNASNLSSGTVPDARHSANVALYDAASPAFVNTLSAGAFATTGNITVTGSGKHAGDGSLLTNLNASSLSTGTVADGLLSSNIPRLGAATSVFSGSIVPGPDSGACTSGKAGAIRWANGSMNICDGSGNWLQVVTRNLTPVVQGLPGLFAWYDASDSSQLSRNGSAVAQWFDKSGHGYTAYQNTASKQPAWGTVTLNGLSTISFTASSSHVLLFPSTPTMSQWTAFYVFQLPTALSYGGASYYPLTFGGTTNTTGLYSGLEIGSAGSGNANAIDIFGGYGNDKRATLTNIAQSGASAPWQVLSWTIGSAHTVSAWSNGNAAAMTDTGGEVAYSVSLGSGSTGDFGGIGGNPWSSNFVNTNVAEIIVYDRPLSAAERQSVEGYLAWKWGLQGSLPSSHPYKSAAPQPAAAPTGSSCANIRAQFPSAPDGAYTLVNGGDTYVAYCDMTSGGWTQVARFANLGRSALNTTTDYGGVPSPGGTSAKLSHARIQALVNGSTLTNAVKMDFADAGVTRYIWRNCTWTSSTGRDMCASFATDTDTTTHTTRCGSGDSPNLNNGNGGEWPSASISWPYLDGTCAYNGGFAPTGNGCSSGNGDAWCEAPSWPTYTGLPTTGTRYRLNIWVR